MFLRYRLCEIQWPEVAQPSVLSPALSRCSTEVPKYWLPGNHGFQAVPMVSEMGRDITAKSGVFVHPHAGQPPLARLTLQNVAQVKMAFNAAKADVRVLVLLSPT